MDETYHAAQAVEAAPEPSLVDEIRTLREAVAKLKKQTQVQQEQIAALQEQTKPEAISRALAVLLDSRGRR